jgi:iron complex outermembrane receptor protein
MKRTACAALVAAALVCGVVSAIEIGGTIAGTVVDPDGAGLPGVLVIVSGEGVPGLRVVSGREGAFRVSSMAPGRYTVRAELEGLQPPRSEAVTVRSGETTSLHLAFAKPVLHEMVEVTSRHDVVTVTDIRESAARDVGEAMATFPGVVKLRKAGIANDIVVRGLQRDNINVLIDGARIYGACPNRMDVPAFHVDFSEIDHVEVTRGPFDIENQGSLGGVVNIVTRQPEAGLHGTADLAAGSDGFLNPSVNASWGGATFSALAGYSYRTSDPYRDANGRPFTEVANYAPGKADTTAFRTNTGWARLFATPGAGQTLELSYTRQEATHVLYPTLQMDAAWDNADRLEAGWQRIDDASILSRVRVRGYATRVRHWMTDDLRTTALGTPRGWSMGTMADTSALGLKADADFAGARVGVEVLRRGWDASTRMAKMGYATQASIPDVATTSVGVFASHRTGLASRLSLDLGARLDRSRSAADPALANTGLYFAYNSTRTTSATDTLPSATARVTWAASPALTISGGVGHTVRVPDPAERYFALKRAGSDWVGNPDLRPVRNTGADVRATWQHSRGAVVASVYYDSLKDWITVHNQARVNSVLGVMNTAARSYANVDAALWGAELEVTRTLAERVFFSAGATWTQGSKQSEPRRLIFSRNMAEIPPLTSRVAVRWDTGRVYAEAEGVAAAAQNRVDSDLQEQRTAGWAVLNLKLGGEISGLRIQGTVSNIFNRQYQEFLSSVRDPFRSGVYVAEPGRSWSVNVIRRF